VHYLLGAVLLATNDEQGGEAEFKKELIISPHDSMTYTALGRIAANRHNYSEAETYLKKAISFGPESPDAYLFLGQIYFTTNRPADAETALRRCVELTTDASRNRYQVQQAHFMLGRIMTQKGQQDAARAEMKIAQELANRTLAQDKSKLAGLMDAGGAEEIQAPPDANTTSSLVVKADPQALHKVESLREQIKLPVADSYNNLGAIAATNSDYSNAVKYFEHAFVWNPSLDGLDYNWGRAAFAGALFGDAVMPLSRYVGAHPDDAGARSVLGISQFMIGNYRGCIEVLEPVIGKTDLASQVEYVYAESMIKTGRIATGAERLSALEKSHPEIPDVHRSLGEALAQQGDKPRALEELHTAIKLSPGDAESHYDLGKMQMDSGDTAAATPELEQAVRLSPNNEKFHEELARAYTAAHREADAQREMEIYNMLHARTQSSTPPPRSANPEH